MSRKKCTESSGGRGTPPRENSEKSSGGNEADLAQDARYRGDGDEASFREKDKRLIAFLPVLSVVFSDSNSWF